jgi:hypothetical protein
LTGGWGALPLFLRDLGGVWSLDGMRVFRAFLADFGRFEIVSAVADGQHDRRRLRGLSSAGMVKI